jgi:NAD(P)-dependent dehydrogenase (short-subunit alcohol dehydrogenase family)
MPDGRTAVVTGANSGLGLECSRALLAADVGWHVVLAVRDPGRGAEAVAQLGQPRRCTVMPLDLASLASVSEFVSQYTAAGDSLPSLHALICNAGLQVISGTRYTTDGIELTFGVNHLGHFALATALLDRLQAPARIVIVSSDTHDPSVSSGMPAPVYRSATELAHPPEADPDEPPTRLGRRRYTTSKLCNLLFTYELDRRLGEGAEGVTVNAFNPGLMPGSGLARDYGAVQRFAWRFLMPLLRVLPQVHSTRESGANLAALASSPEFDGITGKYFDRRKPIRSSADSYDRVKAQDLWQTSERLLESPGGTDSSLS